MHRIPLTLAVAAFTTLIATAEDFTPLMRATQSIWPEKQHIGVICDYPSSAAQIQALAKAAGEGARITVIDTRLADESKFAVNLLASSKADYLVLMPNDRLFYDGSFNASVAVRRLAAKGIPSVGTKPMALQQGAVFSVGDGTKGQVLITDKVIGTIDVILPNKSLAASRAALTLEQKGMATINVHSAR